MVQDCRYSGAEISTTFKGLIWFYIVLKSSTKQKNQKIFPLISFNKDSLKFDENYFYM